ncbi:MAG: RNA methyltransferase [Lachnospiraceae bacterium]|nr:RNA methyltransferase [Lachnospiraceae bacterium]
MITISSASNAKIKKISLYTSRASARKEDGVFIAEGTKLVVEAPLPLLRELYVSESCLDSLDKESGRLGDSFLRITRELPEDAVIKLPDHLFEKISTMKSPQGMMALMNVPSYTFDDVIRGVEDSLPDSARTGAPLVLVLEDIQDPGNVGTIFRTAEAAGVTGIILSEACADPLGPKVVRSAMGAAFRMPFIIARDMPETVRMLEEKRITCYAARLDESSEYDKCDLTGPSALLIGNEGNGLSADITKAASRGIFIPMSGRTESLNAAISASILAYEARRQRNSK